MNTHYTFLTVMLVSLILLLLAGCQQDVVIPEEGTSVPTIAGEGIEAEGANTLPPTELSPTTSAHPEPSAPTASPHGSIEVYRVRVTGDHITFTGRVRPATDQCVQTQLLADGEPEVWWPAVPCASYDEGQWTMAVPLGVDNAPEALDPAVQYVLRAWLRDEPAVLTQFWFDLAPPPAP